MLIIFPKLWYYYTFNPLEVSISRRQGRVVAHLNRKQWLNGFEFFLSHPDSILTGGYKKLLLLNEY